MLFFSCNSCMGTLFCSDFGDSHKVVFLEKCCIVKVSGTFNEKWAVNPIVPAALQLKLIEIEYCIDLLCEDGPGNFMTDPKTVNSCAYFS